ncbi:hypothetical protein B0H14DRAFT_3493909 [Mycena olivaceomarginata]|nr:hypothetical protein B0H14DRAFT_3493909 [Mycena olivaceomarginata]
MPGPALAHNASEYSPADAEDYVRLTFTQNYVLYATSALLVYELLVTFDEEVERVWSLRWRLPKLLFMLNRYVTRGLLILEFMPVIILAHPLAFVKYMVIGKSSILAAQAIMVIRLWAIYNNTRKMLCFLILAYAFFDFPLLPKASVRVRIDEDSEEDPADVDAIDMFNDAPLLHEHLVLLTTTSILGKRASSVEVLTFIHLPALRTLEILDTDDFDEEELDSRRKFNTASTSPPLMGLTSLIELEVWRPASVFVDVFFKFFGWDSSMFPQLLKLSFLGVAGLEEDMSYEADVYEILRKCGRADYKTEGHGCELRAAAVIPRLFTGSLTRVNASRVV